MLKKTVLTLSVICTLNAQTMEEYNQEQMRLFNQQMQGYNKYKQTQKESFEEYKAKQNKVFESFKKELEAIWQTPKLSTKTKWVSYMQNNKTRGEVDFEKESIKIQTIASNPQEAKEKLKDALQEVVSIDTKTLVQKDPLEKRLSKIKKPPQIVDQEIKNEPIISNMIFDKKPTQKMVENYAKDKIKNSKIKVVNSQKIKNEKVYTIEIAMPKDALVRKSKQYYNDVKIQSKKEQLPIALVFAIMHSESSFNPRARSYVPAYGLMQIVPKTAGIDAYNYLYNEKRLVSGNYLYNSKNNITLGSAYLHILYYRYLRKIKNPTSRLYCTIAAYNTGAGNVAWAFTNNHSLNQAAAIINTMTPQEVYNKLINDLRYSEAKRYLQKVSKKVATYHKIYG